MRVEHRLTVRGVCPVDEQSDTYSVAVRCDRVIRVEDILAACGELTKEPVFQERFTADLARELAAEVETVGMHSGVQTTVRCGRAW